MRFSSYTARRRPRWGASLLAFGLIASLAGCDELLEVSNPNNLTGEDILKIAAADGLVNGALSGVARGYGQIMTSYSTVTDELEWVGSRDAFLEHDRGNLASVFNEFTDAEFPFVAQARWMADEAIRVLTLHAASTDPDSTLKNPEALGWAHFYRAISYSTIADMFDDFVVGSDRAEAAAAVGEANMGQLYSDAITSLGTAITIGNAEGDGALVLAATAYRASVAHRQAIWNKVGTRPIDTSNNGLASSAAAVADANTALGLAASADYKYEFVYSSQTVTMDMGSWVNSRQEMRIGPTFASPDPSGPTFTVVSLTDIIDVTTVHPDLDRFILAFSAAIDAPTMPIVSAREMHLIIAEDALAAGNTAGFTTAINNLRALDGLTPFSGQVPALALLIQSRQANLFLMGRRLSDLYRFGLTSSEWVAGSTAMTAPGTFLPITIVECRANENIGTSTTC
ncbi:MAG: hypothetical protein IID05_04715 [Gemmatimonadetes bacterium]|nr:hypothetical protein [Gemmatimonadota bacterium]